MRRIVFGLGIALAFAARAAWGDAELVLETTIAVTAEDFCGNDEYVHVAPGTTVRVCYRVRNVGTAMLVSHDLVDSEMGSLLADFPYNLAVDASAFLTQAFVATETTAFTGTWTAATAADDTASDVDTAFAIVPEADAGAAGVAAAGALALANRRRPAG